MASPLLALIAQFGAVNLMRRLVQLYLFCKYCILYILNYQQISGANLLVRGFDYCTKFIHINYTRCLKLLVGIETFISIVTIPLLIIIT